MNHNFFASNYSSSTFNANNHNYIPEEKNFDVSFIDQRTVSKYIQQLKYSLVAGPDGVPSSILKHHSKLLSTPLTYLFNKSLKVGYFSSFWKQSFISPQLKSGSKANISNYRGIAKLNIILKLFEKLLCDRLSFQASPILTASQHGFCKSRSTITNLEFTTLVNDGFIEGKQTDVIYIDFSKAFDKVNHNLLVHKLD